MSIESDSEPSVHAGNPEEWDAIWAADAGSLFTAERPTSVPQFWLQSYFEDLWDLAGGLEGASGVELGSGRGTMSMYLAARGCEVTLVDLAPSAFDLARAGFASAGLALPNLVLGDACQSGLESDSFDCAYNIGVLEHFDDPIPLLREICRVLRPGGLFFLVIVPHGMERQVLPARILFAPWRPVLGGVKRLLKGRRERSTAGVSPMTRTYFSNQTWEGWMRDAGATDVRCIPYNPYPSVYRSRRAEKVMSVPLYRAHRRLRVVRGHRPALEASSRFGFCQLLVGRVGSAA